MKIRTAPALFLLLGTLGATAVSAPDEGMYPLSELSKLDLRAKGLQIAPEEIFATGKPSLIYAIVSVGATGSFVSPDGLFITNHHVAFGAVQAASTREHDYLTNGFLAGTRAEEIQARGMTARITESFRDVSADVLGVLHPGMALAERTRAIEKRIKEIVAETEKTQPGKRAEVSEMFLGRSYVLFVYTYLKDIRIVYVPPRSIGEFGGEIDNWMWPRHTGDFSFLRAYTAPDGTPADFSPANIPFRPRRFLKINPSGVNENDFVFLLGYPGRTYRHYTASYMAFEENLRMPYVVEWYGRQIALMENAGAHDPDVALKLASRMKSLANTMKNYQGKLKGMKRLALVEKKRGEEKAMQGYVEADPRLRAQYGSVLTDIDRTYGEMRKSFQGEMVLEYLRSGVNMFNFAWTALEASIETRKPDLERESPYMARNWDQTRQRLLLARRNYYEPVDRAVFKELLLRARRLEEPGRIGALDDLFRKHPSDQELDAYVARAYASTRLGDESYLQGLLKKSPDEIRAAGDPFVALADTLYPAYQDLRNRQKARKGALDPLFAQLGDLKEKYLGKNFIPDANSTLRLTYGRIRGYSPGDAVYYRPLTTLAGVLEKTTLEPPFNTPPRISELHKSRDFGRYALAALKDVPVCILYDADTTGGNSGSPVMNARGELVGVNFDRTYEATINDYAWSEDYSRSIAVDIRYVLWVAEKFSGADRLLEELGIPAKD